MSPATRISHHAEVHRGDKGAWLRAAVLGANDGLLSTASLMLGVSAANASRQSVLTAGFAALVAGSLSMAVGEYSSVSSQRDTEHADLDKERHELLHTPEAEQAELAAIYRQRGLSRTLADQVAAELSAGDALAHHAREELGIDPENLSRPTEAALASAGSFAVGAFVPFLMALVLPSSARAIAIIIATIIGLGVLGFAGARLGGAPVAKAAARVVIGGAIALLVAQVLGNLVGSNL
jgi:vacuolar iron transporter family protein